MRLDNRMVKLDGKVDAETVVWLKSGPAVPVANLHLLLYANKAFGRVLFGNAGRLDQKNKGAGAAVHDGHLGRAEINMNVVYAQAGQGRHQMLNGGHPNAIVINQGG